MHVTVGFIFLGFCVGVISGLIGVGGGIFIVPALVFVFGFTQQQAQGTTLALLVPPIGLLAAWAYYKQGYVEVKAAALICLGFFFGGLLGGKLAVGLSNRVLKKVFAAALAVIAAKMLLSD